MDTSRRDKEDRWTTNRNNQHQTVAAVSVRERKRDTDRRHVWNFDYTHWSCFLVCVDPNAPGNAVKSNPRGSPPNPAFRGSHDDRPITPMKASYGQAVSQSDDAEDSQFDFRSNNDRSPTRERDSQDFTQRSQRTMSASQRMTMNSMSRTIDPRFATKTKQENNVMSPSRTIGSATRSRPTAQSTTEDGKYRSSNFTARVDRLRRKRLLERQSQSRSLWTDGQRGENHCTTNVRYTVLSSRSILVWEVSFRKAINALGEQTFEKVYDYLVKQRTMQKNDPSLDDAKIYQGLSNLVKKTGDCFLVEQLVFLEML